MAGESSIQVSDGALNYYCVLPNSNIKTSPPANKQRGVSFELSYFDPNKVQLSLVSDLSS